MWEGDAAGSGLVEVCGSDHGQVMVMVRCGHMKMAKAGPESDEQPSVRRTDTSVRRVDREGGSESL